MNGSRESITLKMIYLLSFLTNLFPPCSQNLLFHLSSTFVWISTSSVKQPCVHNCVRFFETPWTAAPQAPPSIGFSRQEYWSGGPLPSPWKYTILCLIRSYSELWGFPGGSDGKESTFQCRRLRLDPWVWKIPWRREWQPTPVFLPGESHGQRSLVGYSPWGAKESEWLINTWNYRDPLGHHQTTPWLQAWSESTHLALTQTFSNIGLRMLTILKIWVTFREFLFMKAISMMC